MTGSDPQEVYSSHLLSAGHQASQDFDAWVLKLGTAGITLVLGVAALVEAESLDWLIRSGFAFAGALGAGLFSLRLSADGLRKMSEDPSLKVQDMLQFKLVTLSNWLAFAALTAAFVLLAVFVATDAVLNTDGG